MIQLENEIRIIKTITEKYERNLQNLLGSKAKTLVEIFDNLFNSHGNEFNLISSNSIYPTKYYSIQYRIKEPDSLMEKLIRKSIGLQLIRNHSISDSQDVERKWNAIKTSLEKLDDIIGIRIVGELRRDCEKALELLRNHQGDLDNEGINLGNLDKQPERMKNGFEIYKIKCQQNNTSFELQIKSRLGSAWDDLDHAIMYKDHGVTPIKETVQLSLNYVGRLIEQLESFLFDLRTSRDNFAKSEDELRLDRRFVDEIGPILKTLFGTSYDIRHILPLMRAIFNDLKLELNVEMLSPNEFVIEEYEVTDEPLLKSYSEMKKNDFSIKVLETIYISWRKKHENLILTSSNYNQMVNDLLAITRKHVINQVSKSIGALGENDAALINSFFNLSLEYVSSPQLISSEKYFSDTVTLVLKVARPKLQSVFENDDINIEQDKQLFTETLNLILLASLRGKVGEYAKKLFNENIDSRDKVIRMLFMARGEIEKTRLTDQHSTRVMDDAIKTVLEELR